MCNSVSRFAAVFALGVLVSFLSPGIERAEAAPGSWYGRCTVHKAAALTTGNLAALPANADPHSIHCWMVQDQNNFNGAAKRLQWTMNRVYGKGLNADGYFGPNTEKALRGVQKLEGVKQDGEYGTQTMRAMKWADHSGRIGRVR